MAREQALLVTSANLLLVRASHMAEFPQGVDGHPIYSGMWHVAWMHKGEESAPSDTRGQVHGRAHALPLTRWNTAQRAEIPRQKFPGFHSSIHSSIHSFNVQLQSTYCVPDMPGTSVKSVSFP